MQQTVYMEVEDGLYEPATHPSKDMDWIVMNAIFMVIGLIIANAPVVWALIDTSRREREAQFHEDVRKYLAGYGIDKRELESKTSV